MSLSETIDVLARTLYGEARGEGINGMKAVACVIQNRAKAPKWWGRDIISVCLKPYQFSCWNMDDPNRAKLLAVDIKDQRFLAANRVAAQVLDGTLDDITGGATHYYADSISAPRWVRGATFTKQIGHHRFYKDVP